MNGSVIPREQAFADARAVLDRARQRIAVDRSTGRLSPEHELIMRGLEREQADRARTTAQHPAQTAA
ncbi:hypothetical protein [Streptomyces sp. MMS24-I29]|uniref:hypothetical protein n=1 Tax=Streptomyces sp. MMS24-I29 TaxID=3351480 RepID=UPI003C7E96A2